MLFVVGLEKKNSKIKFKDSLEIPHALLELPTFLSFPFLSLPLQDADASLSACADDVVKKQVPESRKSADGLPSIEEAQDQAAHLFEIYKQGTGRADGKALALNHMVKRLRGKKVSGDSTSYPPFTLEALSSMMANVLRDYNAREIRDGEATAKQYTKKCSNLFGQAMAILDYKDGPMVTMAQAQAQVKAQAGKANSGKAGKAVDALMAIREDVLAAVSQKPELGSNVLWFVGPFKLDAETANLAASFPWCEHIDEPEYKTRAALWEYAKEFYAAEGQE